MPGLFGILARRDLGPDRVSALGARMAAALRVRPWLRTEMWRGRDFCGGRVHLGVLGSGPQPLVDPATGARAWFDGEVYADGEAEALEPSAARIGRWVAGSGRGLAQVDGVYGLAHYEEARGRLTLAVDRLGHRPLYVAETPEWFGYASEVKALLAALDRLPPVDEVAVEQFFAYEHLWGGRTLWEGIRLLPPAGLVRAEGTGHEVGRYWSFDQLPVEPLPVDEVRRRFAGLWRRSIARRARPGLTPLLLSGGLDSRMVLAELRRQGREVVAITFGEPGCPDMRIAARCARLAEVPHRRLPLDKANWWAGREEAIWQTDGHVNAVHLHVARVREELAVGSRVTIKNSFGNTLFGGEQVREHLMGRWPGCIREELEWRVHPNPFVSSERAVDISLPDVSTALEGPGSIVFCLTESQRRRTLTGCYALMAYCEVLNPGVDLPLLVLLIGSLAEADVSWGGFYQPFLASEYPEYFRDIPWQHTGRGLDETPAVRLRRGLRRRARNRLGLRVRPHDFVDYDRLVAGSDPLERVRSRDLIVDDVLDGAARRFLDSVPGDARWSTPALGVITLEVYLRQAAGLLPRARESRVPQPPDHGARTGSGADGRAGPGAEV